MTHKERLSRMTCGASGVKHQGVYPPAAMKLLGVLLAFRTLLSNPSRRPPGQCASIVSRLYQIIIMQASILVLLLAISSSLALPAQSATSQDLNSVLPRCYGPDTGTDHSWRDECQWLLDLFVEQRSLPPLLLFGAGGVSVPYIYRGPVHEGTADCEIRIDLLNHAASETIEKWRLWAAGELIVRACVHESGQGARLGGRMTGLGSHENLNVALGKIPVPGPPLGIVPAVNTTDVDVT